MSVVYEIGITEKNNQEIEKKESIEVVASKGIVGDRYFHDFNGDREQITLIESENIDYYNKISGTNIPYVNFRRNIITKNIELNNLVGKNFNIGNVKLFGHRLCDPCKYLQDMIGDQKLVKKLIKKGGLRCEALSSGKISVNDTIKII